MASDKPKRKILIQVDSTNRASLDRFGMAPHTKYLMSELSDGSILLVPVESKNQA